MGYNSIAVVEGLEGLSALEELYMEHQRLPPGESLIFDPLSINAISVGSILQNKIETKKIIIN